MRAVPDVAYNAAIIGRGVLAVWSSSGQGQNLVFRFGGTERRVTAVAGLIAITDQLAGGRMGNINKTLYKLGKEDQGTYFHDVTTGNNALAARPGSRPGCTNQHSPVPPPTTARHIASATSSGATSGNPAAAKLGAAARRSSACPRSPDRPR